MTLNKLSMVKVSCNTGPEHGADATHLYKCDITRQVWDMRPLLKLYLTSEDLHHHQLYAQSSCSGGLGTGQLDMNLPLYTRMIF